MPSWQVEEDTQFVSKKTFDFHKFAEKFKANSVSQQWNTDSNDLAEDFVPSQSPNPHSSTANSDSENEDEIFLVFRGKPNSRVSSFDECQAASGKFESNIIYQVHGHAGIWNSTLSLQLDTSPLSTANL